MNPELELEKARLANVNTDGGKYEEEGPNWLERTLPGVTEWWKTLTTPTEYHKPMSLEEMNQKSTPLAAVQLREAYNNQDNKTIFGQSKPVRVPYTSKEHGAGTLYINSQTGGEVKFSPTELNQAAHARTTASFQMMEGLQQVMQIAGMTGVGVQANRARIQQKKQLEVARSNWATNVTPGQTTVKPNTTAGNLKHQSSRTDIGYDPVYRAAVIRGINPKSKVKAMGDYGSGDISTGESAPTPTIRDNAWLAEQGKRVMRALNRKDPDYDTAYDWLSTWGPWGGHVYQVASAREQGKKQHHKFPKYASTGFLLRQMELVHQGKADLSDILQLHNLAHHYSLAMGGGKWGIQNVLTDPHDAGHTLARDVGWEHKGKPFQKISKDLLTLDTPEEVAYAMVDFIKTKGKPSLEAMLSLEQTYQEAYGSLNPEQMREFIFRKAREEAGLINQIGKIE